MKEQFEKEEVLIKNLLREVGNETTSVDFTNSVMQAIAAKQKIKPIIYQPLISKNAWIVLAGFAIVFVCGLYFITAETPMLLDFSLLDSVKFPQLKLSTTMVYAVGFVSLFFLQIPLLNRFLEKQYH